jgi:acetyl-CoA acyltransferase
VSQAALLVGAVRSPFGLRGGVLSGWHPVDLASELLGQLLQRAGVHREAVDAVILGCASQVGAQSGNIARRATLAAGWPEQLPAFCVECHAASSAQAVVLAAQSVSAGSSNVVVAGGVEAMSAVPLGATLGQLTLGKPFGRRLKERYGRDYLPPGLAAEAIARRFSLNRGALDAWALGSYKKALSAQRRGATYLAPLPPGPAGGALVRRDEALERAPGRAALRGLLPAYAEDGVVTAANLAAEGDGASGVVVVSERAARELGARPLARLRCSASAGSTPDLWPLSMVPATSNVLKASRLHLDDIDWWYVHESSAAAVLAWAAELGVPLSKVNPEGGELATTSPLGAVGAGLFASAAACLASGRGERVGLCVAAEAGVGVACVLEQAT